MTFTERAPAGRFVGACLIAALALALAACGGGSASSQVTGPIGTSTGVAISTATGTSQVQQGVSVVVTASVTNDAVDALGLAIGQAATAVFKAYSVMVAVAKG